MIYVAFLLLAGLAGFAAFCAACCGLDWLDELSWHAEAFPPNARARAPDLRHAARCCAFGILSCLAAAAAWSVLTTLLP